MASDRSVSWQGAAVAAQICLFLYFETSEWLNLYPWNDIRQGNGQEELDIGLGVVMLGLIIASLLRWRAGLWLAGGTYAVWLGLQIDSFWLPYIGGASAEWRHVWDRWFSQTIQVLPKFGNHLPPDACHLVLQVIIVAALVACICAALRLRPRPV